MSTYKSINGSSLKSVETIVESVAVLGGLWLAYKAALAVKAIVKDDKAWRSTAGDLGEEYREHQKNIKNQEKADREQKETQRRENQKDTEEIKKQIHEAFIERAKKQIVVRPQGVRGHWEGNVFIPLHKAQRR